MQRNHAYIMNNSTKGSFQFAIIMVLPKMVWKVIMTIYNTVSSANGIGSVDQFALRMVVWYGL